MDPFSLCRHLVFWISLSQSGLRLNWTKIAHLSIKKVPNSNFHLIVKKFKQSFLIIGNEYYDILPTMHMILLGLIEKSSNSSQKKIILKKNPISLLFPLLSSNTRNPTFPYTKQGHYTNSLLTYSNKTYSIRDWQVSEFDWDIWMI